jgi:hypothetical protein
MGVLSNVSHDTANEFAKRYLECWSVTVVAGEMGIELASSGAGFYVYFLACPESGKLLYVGKGKGDRLNVHHRQFQNCKILGTKKYAAFLDLAKRGLSPLAVVFMDGLSETDAYRLERRLICRIGTQNLANTAPGQASEDERVLIECDDMLRRLRPFEEWRRHYKPKGSSDHHYWKWVEQVKEQRAIMVSKIGEGYHGA